MKFSDIIHDPAKQQFKMTSNGHVAKIDYTKRNNKHYLVHAEVPFALRGQGIGNELVEKTFEYIQKHKMEAVPVCSFVKAIVQGNPRLKELIK